MVLGITGGIASGKSSVCRIFQDRGLPVVSADLLAREAVRPGTPTLRRLVERFGAEILDAAGNLDRPALARQIFADSGARSDLNAIIHPAIASLAEARLGGLRSQGEPLIIYEAPLLFEAGAEGRVDRILVVRVDPEVQLQRLMARDQLPEAEARARIASQLSQDQKVARADFVIDNSGSPEATLRQVDSLLKQLLPSAAPPPNH